MMPEDITSYVWNESGIDIVACDDSDELQVKKNTYFFAKINTKGVSNKTIATLHAHGVTTIKKIASMTVNELLLIPGYKDKSAANIVGAIRIAMRDASKADIMVASNAFGRGIGEKKLDALLAAFPELPDRGRWPSITAERVSEVDGFAKKTAEQLVANLSAFGAFLDELDGAAAAWASDGA